ncbi:nucleolar protein dao-5-like isoform X1 [Sitophilus oryzae]|uniref:Nucleolar protein dao-5-like isoform X1 n=1 Tax=Sitophilus oryzae TaxID=7048 RepID=A0A6J2YHC5_SITOR|nr:nucleolar protein dao-5-like isoform X1 [Sitophilus oryzae]XP_030762293.1 nucleolar protein dao-5-like isoform X1 [Sitophilus oryzae]
MSSLAKPLAATSQSPPAGNQVNKTMHPQGTTASYNQPSHVPQSLGNIHANPTAAHNHQNQPHHYSLNVPNTYSQSMGQIPASNHPIANPSATAAGQGYSLQKTVSSFTANYQTNISHQQQNMFASINQSVTTTQQHVSVPPQNALPGAEKSQSNGTSEAKSPTKTETQDNFPTKEKVVQPPVLSQNTQSSPEKASLPKPAEVPAEAKPAAVAPSSPKPSPVSQTSQSSVTVNVTPTPDADKEKAQELEQATKISDNGTDESDDKEAIESEPEDSKKSEESVKEPSEESKSVERSPSESKTKSEQSPQKESIQTKQSTPASSSSTTTALKAVRNAKAQAKQEDAAKAAKEPKTPVQKSPGISKAKRQRIRTQHYQSPLPEVELVSKISASTPKSNDERLIVFYRNEFLAVRNSEGSFYLCQAIQNIYKSSTKIKIRWLNLEKTEKGGEIYTPDFYDLTDFDCILTNLSLSKVDKGRFKLPTSEKERTQSILNRSLAVEKGEVTSPSLTEEHPDGLDLSLYRDEDQLKKRKARKRKASQKPAKSPGRKPIPTKKSPENAKAKKVVEKTEKPPKKAAVVKKAVSAPAKKAAAQPEPKKPVPSSSRSTTRSKPKSNAKTTSVVDQKKAKVLAKIGKKAAVAKPAQSDNKNAKSGAAKASGTAPRKTSSVKAAAPQKAAQPLRTPKRSSRK